MKAQPTLMLIVHGLYSDLPFEEIERRYRERMPAFREVPGLIQKYYSYDAETGEVGGIYLWDSKASMEAYMKSELRETIAKAYELKGPPQFRIVPLVDVLRSE